MRWFLFPTLAMSLGWALRGFIGGGPLGAMIPGAMIGLVLCLLLDREHDAAWIAAFAAVGIGFGGEETYGQTVGLSLHPETYYWALLGFAVKGGAWGLLGGATIGTAFVRHRYRRPDLIAALALLPAGTWIGWKLINDPKLIYFSNPTDKPRPEVWAGLIAGALLLLAWLALRGDARIPLRFAAWGTAGGALGFAAGAAIQVWGQPLWPTLPLGWWKVMELTFGALLGLAFGCCAWRNRTELAVAIVPEPVQPLRYYPALAFAAIALAAVLSGEELLHTRFNYVIVGAALLAAALYSRTLAWQIAVTLPICAFVMDLVQHKPAPGIWPTALAFAGVTVRSPRARPMFLWLTWLAVLVSILKSYVPPAGTSPLMMESLFAAMALAVTAYAIPRPGTPLQAAPGTAPQKCARN